MRKLAMIVVGVLLTCTGAALAQVTYSNRPPPPPPNYYPGQRPPPPPNYSPNQPPPGYGQQTVSCGSPQYHLLRCPVPPGWRGVRIVQQTSDSACVEGQTWGYDRGSIWVDRGCGGVFAPAYGGGWQPGPGWDREFMVPCGSPQYRYYFCQVDVGARGHVTLQRQYSDAACIEGQTWGWNRAGIWVDKGCGGHFIVSRRW
jgi:hypothetical protein